MAPPPLLDDGAASPIAKIPAELLEQVFLYAVDDIEPPKPDSSDSDKVKRLRNEFNTGVSLAVQTLRFRLVCRQFRDASWRAFGKVIEVTTFDIISPQSMINFQAVAKQPDLAPWVKGITFTCNVIEKKRRGSSAESLVQSAADLPTDGQNGYEKTASWFPTLREDFDNDHLTDDTLFDKVINMLVENLQQYKNIEGITYFWDDTLSNQRLPIRSTDRQYYGTSSRPGFEVRALEAHLGIYVITEALARSSIQPRILDLAVELCGSQAFFVKASDEAIVNMFSRAESLTLRDRYDLLWDEYDLHEPKPEAFLTKTLCPVLNSLNIDFNNYTSMHLDSLPRISKLPNLTSISIIRGNLFDGYANGFLAHHGRYIRSLSIEFYTWTNYSIANAIRCANLDVLIIRQGARPAWIEAFGKSDKSPWMTDDEIDRLKAMATQVVIEPTQLEELAE